MYNVIATVKSSVIDKYTRQVPLTTGSVESEAAAYDAIYHFENRIGTYVRNGCPQQTSALHNTATAWLRPL